MSDGNYNRNLLPYHNYQSGVRAGKAALRQLAIDELRRQIEELRPDLPAGEVEKRVARMREKLK